MAASSRKTTTSAKLTGASSGRAAAKQERASGSKQTGATAGRQTGKQNGKSAAKATGKPGRPRKQPEIEPEPGEFIRAEVMILLSFALAVLLFLSNFHLCGVAGDFLRGVQLGIFGMVGFIAPLLLFVGTCFYLSNRGNRTAMRKIAASVTLALSLCGFAQLFLGNDPEAGKNLLEYYRMSAESGFGGGLVGGLICAGLKSTLGTIGAFLVLLVVFLISVVCITEKSIVSAVKKHSDVAYQHAREDMERRRELHAERQEERRRLRYEQRVRGVDLDSTYLEPYDEDEEYPDGEEAAGAYADNVMTEQDAAEHKEQPVSPADIFTGNISMPDTYGSEDEEAIPFDVEETEAAISAQQLVAEGIGRFEEEQEEELFLGRPASEWDALRTGGQDAADSGAHRDSGEEIPRIMPNNLTGGRRAGMNASAASGAGVTAVAAGSVTGTMAGHAAGSREVLQDSQADTAPWDSPAEPVSVRTESAPVSAEDESEHVFLDAETDMSQYQPEPVSYAERYTADCAAGRDRNHISDHASGRAADHAAGCAADDITDYASGNGTDDSADNILRMKQTESDGSFAIPEEAKRVVTAGGKVIETDTEALQKKLESKKKEAQEAGETSLEQQIQQKEEAPKKEYVFPPVSLLKRGSRIAGNHSEREYRETAIKLQQTLHNFGVGVTVTNISCGPSVTRYELHPEQGVKVSKIVGLTDDIKLSLAAEEIRIEAPIPGKSAVGIEVPNKENNTVYLRDLLESENFQKHSSRLAFAVGKDIGGQVVVTDIAKMPHLLIAGATGSGKSVCINTLIMSIIFKSDPEDVKLIMVDPKVVELSVYNGIPHLLIPVVTDPKKASGALNWAVAEMTDRYKKFAEYNVRDLKGYNAKIESIKDIEDEKKPKRLPQIVIIVDELADLMMVAPGEVEDAICRLAQLARAAGIHLVIATQRPSVNVITGLIKANIPSRIAFSVSSGVDSRTIIDMNGAEKLLGKGDMLFYPAGFAKPQRVQGAFVSDTEVQKVVDFLTEQGMTADYRTDVEQQMNAAPAAAAGGGRSSRDEYFEQAGKFIIEKEKASIGMLQRVFKIGFNRAARIMDQLAEAGVVGEEEGTKPRKVLMTMEEFEEMSRS